MTGGNLLGNHDDDDDDGEGVQRSIQLLWCIWRGR